MFDVTFVIMRKYNKFVLCTVLIDFSYYNDNCRLILYEIFVLRI